MVQSVAQLLLWLASELAFFAGFGFLVFAIDELLVDILWLARAGWRKFVVFRVRRIATTATIGPSKTPGRLAIFVPAWDESAVIGDMLAFALKSYGSAVFDIFVGCYPNDPGTIAAIEQIGSPRVVKIVCDRSGPTTKGHCLNALWAGLELRQAMEGIQYKGVVLHDAEDVVADGELAVFDWMLDRFDFVQLPVIPLPDRGSRLISGHYCDEFAESHGKTLMVREWLGAAIPAAGVGCAIGINALVELAERKGGNPFDTASLTEDYELGLTLHAQGWRTAFVSLPRHSSSGVVATQAHFPATLDTSVRQKTRWMIGIALAGWDRLGWGSGWGENWMRWRDRRVVLAAVLISAGYLALILFTAAFLLSLAFSTSIDRESPTLKVLLNINLAFLAWRIVCRGYFVWRVYGIVEALLSVVRLPIASIILVMSARRAVVQYWRMARGAPIIWDKTTHQFPADPGNRH
jgi:bacteriophage N4 adsorption protein B